MLRPLVVLLVNSGFTANKITLIALLLSFLGGVVILFANYKIFLLFSIPFIMFIRMALNAIDGMMAKEHNMISKKGAMLNELSDVLSDIFIYLPFVYFLDVNGVVIFVILAIISEFIGVLSQAVYNNRRYDGPMGKSDRAFIFGMISILLAFNLDVYISNIILFVSILLLIYTIFNRWHEVVK